MIAWEESGSGPSAVLVHGITEDRRVWDDVVPLLEHRFRCIRLDLRGHGASGDADDYSALAMADDVAAVVAEADLDEPPLLVGHSLGAVVVTAYATQAPARGVVNIDQPLRLGDFATALQPMAEMLRGPQFAAAIEAIVASLGVRGLSEPQLRYLAGMHETARQDVVLGVWSQVLDASPDDLTSLAEALLAAVTVPYLAIHGGDPGPGYEEWLAKVLPSSTFEVWPGLGHYPHLAQPQPFADRLILFDDALER